VLGREGFDGRLRAFGRENRREEVAVRCGEDSRAGMVVFGGNLKFKHQADYTILGNWQ